MAAIERDVLNQYNIPTAYPTEWPAELDDSDDDSNDAQKPAGLAARRSKSRYSALERNASDRRSVIPGAQKTEGGRANLVQKDEPDPLGRGGSVVQTLKSRGIKVEDDARKRNQYLLSSTTFSPTAFLAKTHSDDSAESLFQGLDYLTKSIDQKSASLKVLVESNFERFVRAKATIDNVYTEMRQSGAQEQSQQQQQTSSRPGSRQVSRQSGHFRNFSSGSGMGLYGTPPLKPAPPRKNALVKESEYGVIGIKTPLAEITQKAEDVWGPALGGREREDNLKAVIQAIEKDHNLYDLGANLSKSIKQRDYEAVIEQYNHARRLANDSKALVERVANGQQQITDQQIHQILITGRMWIDVDNQVKALKRDIWRKLTNTNAISVTPNQSGEEHMELIGVLLELGVEENPISAWLQSKYDYLKNKVLALTERSRVEVEISRRRLAATDKPDLQTSAFFLKQASKEGSSEARDTEAIIEMWELVLSYLSKLLSSQNGALGEVVEFWEVTQSFINGDKQKMLPTGFEGSSRVHHRLPDETVQELKDGTVELVSIIRESVLGLFADPPIEDISALFSPLPPNSPNTPISALSAGLSPIDPRFGARLDPRNMPPPSPKQGEPWEEFAFWPPYSNSLSAAQYLSRALVLLGSAASEMAALRPVSEAATLYEKIKSLVSGSRERCVKAMCVAWNRDAENVKNIEDWTRSPEQRDQTKMPTQFVAFEQAVLLGMQKILYISEASTRPGTADVITPPPTKLLSSVRSQFVTSIYKALSGMVENAQQPIKTDDDEWVVVSKAMTTSSTSNGERPTVVADAIDASSRNVRMLLTLSNLKALRTSHVPDLIGLFESYFSVKLTDESKTIRDAFGQIDNRLFQTYTRPTTNKLDNIIKRGISSPDWAPRSGKPNQVRPYVYNVMLTLVITHTEVTTTTSLSSSTSSSPSSPTTTTQALTHQILSQHLESISASLLESFNSSH